MLDLEPADAATVREILACVVPDCDVLVYGSRVDGRAATYSDLDLALKGDGPLDPRRIEALRDALSASDLPILVDVIDWHAVDVKFRARIDTAAELFRRRDTSAETSATHPGPASQAR